MWWLSVVGRVYMTGQDDGRSAESSEPKDDSSDDAPVSRRSALKLAGLAAGGVAGFGGFEAVVGSERLSMGELHVMGGGVFSRRAVAASVAQAASESEPNDSYETAVRIDTNQPVTGSAPTADADWFVFDAPADESLTIRFDREGTDALTALVVHGPSGRLLDVTFVGTAEETTLDVTTTEQGTHSLEVAATTGSTGSYELLIADSDYSTPTPTETPEPTPTETPEPTPTETPEPTPTKTPTPTPTPDLPLAIEAESAAGKVGFEPFTVRSDVDASNGQYIVVPEGTGEKRNTVPENGRARYTVRVPEDGEYALWGRVNAQSNGNSFRVSVDGGDPIYWDSRLTPEFTWAELGRDDGATETLDLSAGTHTLEVIWREDGTRLDKLVLAGDLDYEPSGLGPDSGVDPTPTPSPSPTPEPSPTPTPEQRPYGRTPASLPGRLQAENFDTGGQGIAYSDTGAANEGGAYRDTAVDLQPTDDTGGGYNVGWIEDGEYLEYTVDLAGSEYEPVARVASPDPADGAQLVMAFDNKEVARIDVPQTGGWQTWETVSFGGPYEIPGGERVLKLTAIGGDFNVNWVALREDDDGGSTPTPTPEPSPDDPVTITGEPKVWHDARLVFDGPATSERDDPNPFTDYRLNVTFTGPSGQTYDVPGYFAADANAARTGARSGSKWVAHLNPDEAGTWSYEASFRTGENVAVSRDDAAGEPTGFDGASGTFEVAESDASGADFRAKGLIRNPGGHYLTHAGTGEVFLKGGPNVPENFMGYAGFDNTPDTGRGGNHEYSVHEDDWRQGDPDWGSGDGRGIVGALNFIADAGGNSIYFLPNNIGGDGEETFPHLTPDSNKTRYDVSKLAQWEIAFAHAETRGIHLHFVLAETERGNETYYDGGELGVQRKLFYRELIARFGHHNGIQWNVGEENDFGTSRREAFAAYLADVDPYPHPVTTHTKGGQAANFYEPLLGNDDFGITSFQDGRSEGSLADLVATWRERSADSGVPWVVSVDEPQKIENDLDDDADGYPHGRKRKMWPTYMGGGGGFEWYIQRDGAGHSFDQNVDDLTQYEEALNWTAHAREFLTRLPLAGGEVANADERISNVDVGDAYCLSDGQESVAVYRDTNRGFDVDLPSGTFRVRYFNPRTGDFADDGTVSGGTTSVGSPPFDGDTAVLFERQ
jgi:hypothetical protein